MKKLFFVLSLAALLGAAPATAQVDFSRYVALGDSLTAGFVSGGLVDYYQEHSYPAYLAQQGGTPDFELPLVSQPGLPPLLELKALLPNPVIQPIPGYPGMPYNAELARPYNNLGVPGADVYDLMFTTGDIYNLLAGNQNNVMHDLILRVPAVPDPTTGDMIPFTALVQAISLQPTFVTMWIGNNDILGAAVAGTPIESITMTPVDVFQELYGQALGALATKTSAKIVVVNLPNVTAIPFVRTVSNYVDVPGLGTVQLEGEYGPIEDDDYITLAAASLIAQGYGLPGFPPLPEDLNPATGEYGVILRAEEVQIIGDRIAAFNQIIEQTAAAFGVPVMDINTIFDKIAAGDRWILGGVEISADFLLGGIFSYDGVHPQTIGYGLVATELIKTINQAYGADIPQLNMQTILFNSAEATMPAGTKAADVVFSQAAWDRLKELFPAHLPVRNPINVKPEAAY